MKSTVSFPALVQRFFTERLMQQRQASPHTISSYRDTFRLLLRFAYKRLHKRPDHLAFEDINAPLVTAFLNDLEKTRAISARTRNLRLTAIRSFFRYAAFEAPAYSVQIQRVLSMPGKRYNRRLIHFLTRPEVKALLAATDKHTWCGRRDHALLRLAVETRLRVSEMTSLTREDVTLGTGAHVDVVGKGRKQRVTPFSKQTAAILKAWMKEPHIPDSDALFPSVRGGHLSSDAVQRLLKKYTTHAARGCPSLRKKRVTPHVLRHYVPFGIMSGDTLEPRRSTGCRAVKQMCSRVTRHNLEGLKTVQEVEELVCRLETSWLAVSRSCLLKGLFLHRKGRFDIDLRGFHRFMPEPQRDDRATNA
jgi:site-specific recombinase XerD